MKDRLTKGMAFILAIVLTLMTPFTGMTVSASEKSQKEATEKATIWVVGDSTVSSFTDNYYYPRYGWGTQLDKFFDGNKFEIQNIALSGRSSKSFTTEPQYQTLLKEMKQGDFLFIGFGHNDEKTEVDRFTNPNGDYTKEGSFANSLYENYIKKAKEAGCTPVLMTPIVRRTTDANFSNSQLHITSTSVALDGTVFEGGDYPQAIRDLGQQLSVPVVDMTAMTKELYTELGAAGSLYLHAWTSNKDNSVDNTHTNIFGATYNGYLIAKTIKEQAVEGLADYVVDSMIQAAPTKEVYLHSNPAYIVPEYSNDLKDSALWDDYGVWKGTVFGDIGGGAPTKDNFTVGKDDAGNMNIAVRNGKGKISGNTDGVAMYYYKVPVGKNFSLTATATVNKLDNANDQVSFGLMARDDMYIDVYDPSTLGDYVAAGPLKMKTAKWSCFARKSGTLTQGGTMTNPIELNQPIDLKIESNSDGYACSFGKEQTITGGFDFQLTSIDSEYVYVGMFAARNADITFTNIKLVVDGTVVTGQPEEVLPTTEPTEAPTTEPTAEPTVAPTEAPTTEPTVAPTEAPTTEPTVAPTVKPTVAPTKQPTQQAVKVATVKNVKASSVKKDSMKLSWNKATNASRYEVQIYKNQKWVTVKTTKNTSATVTKLSAGTSYKFRVRGYATVSGKTVYGSYSKKITTATLTKAPKVSVKAGKKKATVTLKKVTGASGYEVYMSTKKSSGFKKVKTIKTAKPQAYTAKNLKSGKAYYFKARTYKTVNGKKVYSAYSTVKKVVVK